MDENETVAVDIPPLPVAVATWQYAVETLAKAAGAWRNRPNVVTGGKLRAAMDALETALVLLNASVPVNLGMMRGEVDAVVGSQRIPEAPDPVSRLALPPMDWIPTGEPVNGRAHPEADDEDPDVKWK